MNFNRIRRYICIPNNGELFCFQPIIICLLPETLQQQRSNHYNLTPLCGLCTVWLFAPGPSDRPAYWIYKLYQDLLRWEPSAWFDSAQGRDHEAAGCCHFCSYHPNRSHCGASAANAVKPRRRNQQHVACYCLRWPSTAMRARVVISDCEH